MGGGLVQVSKECDGFGGFNLRKWHTNSVELYKKQPEWSLQYDIAMSEKKLQSDKILRVLWDRCTDAFMFKWICKQKVCGIKVRNLK